MTILLPPARRLTARPACCTADRPHRCRVRGSPVQPRHAVTRRHRRMERTSTRSSRSFAPKPPGSCAPAGPPGSSSGAAHYRAVEAAEPTGAGPGGGHPRPCLASPRLCGAPLPGSPLAPPFGRRRLVSGWTGGLGRRGMSDGPGGPGPDGGGAPHHPEGGPRVLERLDASECLQLIGGGRLGRLAYTGRVRPTALPVVCKLREGPVSSTPSRTPSPRGPADRHRAR